MKTKEVLIKAFFTPSLTAMDLIFLSLCLLIFNSVFVQIVVFFVYYFLVSRSIVRSLGVKKW